MRVVEMRIRRALTQSCRSAVQCCYTPSTAVRCGVRSSSYHQAYERYQPRIYRLNVVLRQTFGSVLVMIQVISNKSEL